MSEPAPHSSAEGTRLAEAVEQTLAEVRSGVASDGGDVELLAIEPPRTPDAGPVVRLRAKGRCFRCPMSLLTLRAAVHSNLRARFPTPFELIFEG